MKKITKFVMGLLLLLIAGVSVQAAPTMPQTDGSTYYYIIFKRSNIGNYLVLQDMGDNVTLRSKAIVWDSNDQLWKIEAGSVADTYKITSKSGRSINFASNRFQASSTASVNIKFVAGNDYYELQREENTNNRAMNPFGGSNVDKEIGEWNIGDGGNALKFVTAKYLFDQKVAEAEELIASALIGNKVGQISAESKSTLETSVSQKKTATYTNDQAYITAIDEINSAIQTFNNSIKSPTLSTADSEVWYYIQGTRPENSYLTDKGEGNQIKSETVIPNDTQLWKFVQEGTGFLMVNKSTSLYLNSDLNTGSNLPTVSAKPTRTLKVRKSNEQSNGIYRLHIENADGNISFRLHAGGSGNAFGAMNWTGNANDNCSWEIIEYSTEAVKAFLLEEINKANSLSNSLSTGTDFGQITPTNKETFTQAIAAAQAVYENPSASETQINQAKADLTQAISNITVETNTNKLISSNEQNYRWYHIVSMSTLEYVAGKVISSEDRDTGNKYTYATKDNSNYSQLFRFENNSEGKVKIINYAQGQLAADGKIADNGADFSLNLLEDKISFNIVAPESNPIHAQQSGSDIVTWTGGVGSASAWKFEFVRELDKTTTNVANTPLSSLAITVSNGIINVAGADSFEVYSIAGQRINTTQPLLKGIYIVKTATTTQKVLVK